MKGLTIKDLIKQGRLTATGRAKGAPEIQGIVKGRLVEIDYAEIELQVATMDYSEIERRISKTQVAIGIAKIPEYRR